jgi:hypothetical protein
MISDHRSLQSSATCRNSLTLYSRVETKVAFEFSCRNRPTLYSRVETNSAFCVFAKSKK